MEKIVQCPVCLVIKRNKRYFQCTQSHSLCEDCFGGLNHPKTCPTCREGFNNPPRRMLPVEEIIRTSNELTLECEKCDFSAKRNKIEKHEAEECPEGSMECCGQIFSRKNKAQHLKNFHNIICPNGCPFKGNEEDVASHLECSCPKTIVQCHNCPDSMERCQMIRHYNTVHLPCRNVNCSVAGTREDMEIEPLESATSCIHPGFLKDQTGGASNVISRIPIWPSSEWSSDQLPKEIRCISLLGTTLYIGGYKGFFGMMDVKTLMFTQYESGHGANWIFRADNNGSDRLILGDYEGKVSLWDVSKETAPVRLDIKSMGANNVTCSRLFPESDLGIVSINNSKEFLVLDARTSLVVKQKIHTPVVSDIYHSPVFLFDSNTLLVGLKGFICVYSCDSNSTWTQSGTLQVQTDKKISSIHMYNHKSTLLVGYNDSKIIEQFHLPVSMNFRGNVKLELLAKREIRKYVLGLKDVDGMIVAKVGCDIWMFSSDFSSKKKVKITYTGPGDGFAVDSSGSAIFCIDGNYCVTGKRIKEIKEELLKG